MIKKTKAEVDFRPGNANKACGMCVHWKRDNSCSLVQGYVAFSALCDLFERIEKKAA